jgi:phosphotransferase system enzyme I (PtsI)
MHKGIAVSPGVVVGIAYRVDSVFGSGEPEMLADPGQVPAEIECFKRAVAQAVAELEAIVAKVAQQLGSAEASIFQSHLQIVNDQALLAKVHDLIEVQQLTALSALQLVLQGYAATFARIEHDYFRERIADVRDVISRIGSHLSVQSSPFPGVLEGSHEGEESVIIVANELLPSQAMNLGAMAIAGIVTETGGGTSHAAILSRSRGIPAVSGVTGITNDVRSGDLIIVDGRDGWSWSGPIARRSPPIARCSASSST